MSGGAARPAVGDRLAGIDCGTNSIRLLISEVAAGGSDVDPGAPALREVHRELRVVRLGEGVDRSGRLSAAALERTGAALLDYARTIARCGAVQVRMVATSAARDAGNYAEFEELVRGAVGVTPDLITGLEEAELSFVGAVAGLPVGLLAGSDPDTDPDSDPKGGRPSAPDRGSLLVADIGGGSTELVLGSAADGQVSAAHSMDVGCVRLTERIIADDPPTAGQIARTVAAVRRALDEAARDVTITEADSFVGVAGTVTTLAALALELPRYDSAAIHGAQLRYEQVAELTDRLLRMSHAERVALPVMHPGRADIIVAGALILRTVMEAARLDAVIASEHDILDGIVLSLL